MLAENADKFLQITPLQLIDNTLKIDVITQDDEKISDISDIDENKNTQKKVVKKFQNMCKASSLASW
jgi:hypothetical protein